MPPELPPDFPPVLYLPATAHVVDFSAAEIAMRRTRDGRVALLAYSPLDRLKHSCGADQPWILLSVEGSTTTPSPTSAVDCAPRATGSRAAACRRNSPSPPTRSIAATPTTSPRTAHRRAPSAYDQAVAAVHEYDRLAAAYTKAAAQH